MLASEQKGEPAMEDLGDWAHHQSPDTVICKVCLFHTCCCPPDTVARHTKTRAHAVAQLVDDVLQRAWDESVSFVFSTNVEGNAAKMTIGQ